MSKSKFVKFGEHYEIVRNQPVLEQSFYGKLASHIQVLETMGKVKETGGFVHVMLNKIPGIRADFVWLDDNRQK